MGHGGTWAGVRTAATTGPDMAQALMGRAEHAITEHWQQRIVHRLQEALLRESREGLPIPLPTSEQAAMSIIRQMGAALLESGAALEQAAQHLKHASRGSQASAAYVAGVKAKRYARELIGE